MTSLSIVHKSREHMLIFLSIFKQNIQISRIQYTCKIVVAMAENRDVEVGVGESITSPLIQTEKKVINGKEDRFMVYFTTFVVVCGSYAFGSCVGYSSPTQSAITEDVHLSLAQYSLFSSLLTFGAMIGAITSGKIADYVGRKGAMTVSSGFCTAGWLAIYFAKGVLLLDIGRLATGYGMGVFSFVVPVFVAEISPKDLRGALTTTNQLMICIGGSVSFIIGTVITWRTLALTGIVPCAVLVLGLFFIPESPRWLAKRGNQKEFEASLRKLRGKNADLSEEAAEIQDYIETLDKLPKAKLLDLFQKRYRSSVTIGVGLMIFQQFGGINGVCFYTSSIFESSGFPVNVGTISYAIIQVIITALGALLIDRAGRKPLLVVSGSGLVVGCLLIGTSYYLREHGIAVSATPALAVTGILVYGGAFSVGMGAVPWVVMSEIFPINTKGAGGSLATLVNWFGAWACSYTFNFLMAWSSYGTFGLYAAINALAILFVIKIVPETKGRTLEEIQIIFATGCTNFYIAKEDDRLVDMIQNNVTDVEIRTSFGDCIRTKLKIYNQAYSLSTYLQEGEINNEGVSKHNNKAGNRYYLAMLVYFITMLIDYFYIKDTELRSSIRDCIHLLLDFIKYYPVVESLFSYIAHWLNTSTYSQTVLLW